MSYSNKNAEAMKAVACIREAYLSAVDRIFVEEATARGVGSWLDVGSGDGERVIRLADRLGIMVDVLEPSDLLPPNIHERPRVGRVHRASIQSFRYEKSYDAISLMWSVLGYLDDWQSEIRRAYNALAPGGILVLDVNNFWNMREYGPRAVTHNLLSSPFSLTRSFTATNLGPSLRVNLFSPLVVLYLKRCFGHERVSYQFLDYANGDQASFLTGQLLVTIERPKPTWYLRSSTNVDSLLN